MRAIFRLLALLFAIAKKVTKISLRLRFSAGCFQSQRLNEKTHKPEVCSNTFSFITPFSPDSLTPTKLMTLLNTVSGVNPDWHCRWLGNPLNAGGVRTKCCLSLEKASFI